MQAVIRSGLRRLARRIVRGGGERTPPNAKAAPEPVARDRIHDYWRRPDDGANDPELYIEGAQRSALLLRLVAQHVADQDARILELGCNVGRNLEALRAAGYGALEGVEISQPALDLLAKTHPELAEAATLRCGTIEATLPQLPADHFDLVYTMAVLEHVHPDSADEVFEQMVRVAKRHVFTIEDEACASWRHFPRDYGEIFAKLGLEVVDRFPCGDVEGLGPSFRATVFAKR